MRIEVFPAASGDCLLITSSDDKRMLADAGLPDAYDTFIAAPLAALRHASKAIDVVYVSHIDRDHIGGVLRLLDDEVKWRVFDHMQSNGMPFKQPAAPRPPEVRAIWHNAFLEDIARSEDIKLDGALAASANALAGLNAAGLGTSEAARAAERAEMLALSVGDAIEVNWRVGDDQLGIPLNPDVNGAMMVARPKDPIALGSMQITVLGPTKVELKELRKQWIAWLKGNETYLRKLRESHRKDIDDLRNGLSPTELARRIQQNTKGIEGDVTPPNLASLVLLVEGDGRRILMTGDAGDESLMKYLTAANLIGDDKRLDVDVLKVPHHGAHNSYSTVFVEKIRARHYIYCGDGEHHNPEPEVVKGYIRAVEAAPLAGGESTTFWFNCSTARCEPKHSKLWQTIEGFFQGGGVASTTKARFLARNADRHVVDIS
ncbi:MBL fold metallo-hydrolase [Rhizobium viscosum]|uniref:Beta-lactamase superfamily II metal-dependent hydrolase n=1 Tax=Rhizobium viscosum TaxID=1673 RepID=A0ABR9J026_RHIVS|nr:MBL fold metallo-hydrolase [Rhizobium viscosum]MBE1508690.1 beta-lactamase superfamily II metal-dependent hydrolase [Rhizobium viscosum]